MYKPAYNYAYISKKDFQTDEVESLKAGFGDLQCFPEQAWPYYAAAAELAALSMFMLSSTDPGKGSLPRSC